MKTLAVLALLTASYLPEEPPEPIDVMGEDDVRERLNWYLHQYN